MKDWYNVEAILTPKQKIWGQKNSYGELFLGTQDIFYAFHDLQLRRHGSVVTAALKNGPDVIPMGFQSETLEFAEISSDLNQSLSLVDLKTNEVPFSHPLATAELKEALKDLNSWSQESIPQTTRSLTQQQSRSFEARSITLNVTQICNLHCHYCAAGGDGTYQDPQRKISVEKTLPQLKFFLEKLRPGENFHVSFLGGEPLLYPEGMELICRELTDRAREKQISVSFKVTTNGTLMSEKIIQMLKQYQIRVVISCDGKPEVQDQRRPSKAALSSSQMVERTLNLLAAHSDIKMGVHAVFDAQHTKVMESYLYFLQFPFHFYEFTFTVFHSKDSAATQDFLNELFQVAQYAYQKGGMEELKKIENLHSFFRMFDEKRGIRNHCGIGKSFLMVDAKNEIYPCPWMVGQKDKRWGVGTDFLVDERFSADLIDLHNCQTCWAKNLCGGGCHFIHSQAKGEKFQKNIDFCERTRGTALIAFFFYGHHHALQEQEMIQTDLTASSH